MANLSEIVEPWYREGGLTNVLWRGFHIAWYLVLAVVASMLDRDVSIHGLRFPHDSGIDLLTRATMMGGVYEEEERRFVETYLPSDVDVIELGAGIGFISCYTNRRLDNRRTHVVVEANPELVSILRQEGDLNGCDFAIEHAAYAPNDDLVKLRIIDDFLGSSVYGKGGQKITVPACSLEEITSTYNIDKFALIVDIEGSEAYLSDEIALLKERCPIVIVELHRGTNTGVSKVVDELSAIYPTRERSRSDKSVMVFRRSPTPADPQVLENYD